MVRPLTRRRFLGAVAVAGTATGTGDRSFGEAGRSGRSKVVDSHVHLKHGDAAQTEFSARTVVDIMDQAGIDQSVVFAMCTTTKRSIAMAESAVAEFPDRLIPYAYARAELDKVRRLHLGQGEIDAILGGNLLKLIAKTGGT